MDGAPSRWAETSQEREGGVETDINRRRVRLAQVAVPWSAAVNNRLQALIPALGSQFRARLCIAESPQFLSYWPGHFYTPHRDVDPNARRGGRRKITLILQLSDLLKHAIAEPQRGWHCGGSLLVHTGREYESVIVRPGDGVAFPASYLHAVTPVTAGVRQVVVAWYA